MDKDIAITLEGLRSRGLKGFFVENREEANAKILGLIPQASVVGIGDSTTLRQIGVIEELKKRGTAVHDGFFRGVSWALHFELLKEATLCDAFLTGTNAVTLDGRLVNVDGLGNRVAGIFYGHPISVVIVGRNKLVKNLDEAFYRIRNIIAPNHVRIRAVELGGMRRKTPCVVTGECNDCRSKDRACNIFTIIEGKPMGTNINVVIVNDDLGLAWDKSWPKERVSRIIEEYKKYAWIPPPTDRYLTNRLSSYGREFE
jgi:hypothetical protein